MKIAKVLLSVAFLSSSAAMAEPSETICAAEILGSALVVKVDGNAVARAALGAQISIPTKINSSRMVDSCVVENIINTNYWATKILRCSSGSYKISIPSATNHTYEPGYFQISLACVDRIGETETRGCAEDVQLNCDLQF